MLKQYLSRHLLILVIGGFILPACKKMYADKEAIVYLQESASIKKQVETQRRKQVQYADGMPTVLGRQYPIPFTPEIMEAAKGRLDGMKVYSPNALHIRTTHLYVKFSPKNQAELELLENDSTLLLSDMPLDYEVSVRGSWYKERELPDSVPTPHYAVVKNNYRFNRKVPYTILSNLYVPDEDPVLVGDHGYGMYYADMLIYMAYGIAGLSDWQPYELMPHPGHYDEGAPGGPVTPRPSGVIKIYDNRLAGYMPLEGVRVTAKKHIWGSAFRQGYTNADGVYYMDGYQKSGTSTYTIWFKREGHFKIRDNMISESKVVRYEQNRSYWSYNIGEGYECMQGHMFRAAYRYYFKDIDGLKRPLRPFGTQSLVAKNTVKDWAGINYVLFPVLKVARYKGPGKTNEYDADEIFGATIHELAHTAHVLTMNSVLDYWNVSKQIRESWAIAVQWQLTNKEYRERGINTYGNEIYYAPGLRRPHSYAFQDWALLLGPNPLGPSLPAVPVNDDYTSLFINLTDDFNELGKNLGTASNPLWGAVEDRVKGYYLGNIQAVFLKNLYGKSSMAIKLKDHKPGSVSNTDIDRLLSYY